MVKMLINRMRTFTRNDAIAEAELSLHVRIPSGYTSIEEGAFLDLGILSVLIPFSITSISNSAFEANELTRVTIPDSVTSIGDGAFEANRLTRVTIPDSVTTIGDGAFKSNSLTSVTIPDSVTSIGDDAFGDNMITRVTIPDSVTSIGEDAFIHNGITSVTIPDSVTSISKNAFDESTIVTIESSSTYILPIYFENLTLTGTAAINGTGNKANNILKGNSGNNNLNGGAGKDTLTGSKGVDKFIYRSITDSRVGSAKRDVITDFKGSPGEKIDLFAIDAYTKTSGNQAFAYIGSNAFTGNKGEVRFSGGVLQMNTGTDKIADMEIALTGVTSFSQNFLVL